MRNFSKETRLSAKFYTTLFLGWITLMISLFLPPTGVIDASALYGAGMLLILSAGCIGVDLVAVILEFEHLVHHKYTETNDTNTDLKILKQ